MVERTVDLELAINAKNFNNLKTDRLYLRKRELKE